MIHGPHPILAPWLRFSWLPKIAIIEGPEHLEGPCWLWLGARTADGYGVAQERPKGQFYLHRRALEDRIGFLLGNLEADHLCLHRNCIQGFHLKPATRLENMAASSFYEAGKRNQFQSLTPADWLSIADTSWCRIASGYA